MGKTLQTCDLFWTQGRQRAARRSKVHTRGREFVEKRRSQDLEHLANELEERNSPQITVSRSRKDAGNAQGRHFSRLQNRQFAEST